MLPDWWCPFGAQLFHHRPVTCVFGPMLRELQSSSRNTIETGLRSTELVRNIRDEVWGLPMLKFDHNDLIIRVLNSLPAMQYRIASALRPTVLTHQHRIKSGLRYAYVYHVRDRGL